MSKIIDLFNDQQQFYDTLSGVGTWDPAGERMVLHEGNSRAYRPEHM